MIHYRNVCFMTLTDSPTFTKVTGKNPFRNNAANYDQGKTLIHWASGIFTNASLVSTWEIPFANTRFKTLYPVDLRAFGRDIAAGYREYLDTPNTPCAD